MFKRSIVGFTAMLFLAALVLAHGAPLIGTVTEVGKDSITIKTHAKKKKGQAIAGQTKTFTITEKTKIHKGGKKQPQPADLAALSKGQHVVVLAKNQQAKTVIIQQHKKKKAA